MKVLISTEYVLSDYKCKWKRLLQMSFMDATQASLSEKIVFFCLMKLSEVIFCLGYWLEVV